MAVLLVDVGNTSIKWAYLENSVVSNQTSLFYDELPPAEVFSNLLRKKQKNCKKVFIVSVLGKQFNSEAKRISEKFSLLFEKVKSTSQLAQVTNAYDDPEKLGSDRLVGMIAAYHLSNPRETDRNACIIIDTGTATTIDAVDSNGNHLGGLILPGLELCRNSLLDNTKQLSQWNQQGLDINPTIFAKETTSAITSASIFGLAGAIDSICNKMENEIQDKAQSLAIKRVICGGNAKSILPFMGSGYLFRGNLIMLGLSIILKDKERYK